MRGNTGHLGAWSCVLWQSVEIGVCWNAICYQRRRLERVFEAVETLIGDDEVAVEVVGVTSWTKVEVCPVIGHNNTVCFVGACEKNCGTQKVERMRLRQEQSVGPEIGMLVHDSCHVAR